MTACNKQFLSIGGGGGGGGGGWWGLCPQIPAPSRSPQLYRELPTAMQKIVPLN